MFKLEFNFKAYNRIRNDLRRKVIESPEIAGKVIWQWALDTRQVLKQTPYPPKRPNQRYVRTGRLANSWRVVKQGTAQYQITNSAQAKGRLYAGYVVGPPDGPPGRRQAWMHKGRWWIAQDIVVQETPKLTKALTEELTRGI